MKNKGLIITIIILIICVLGLSSFIIYDKVLNKVIVDNEYVDDAQTNNNNEQVNDNEITDNNNDNNVNNGLVVNSAIDFINKIANTEDVLENESKYEVSFNDLKFTVYKSEVAPSNFDNIIITYKDKVINKSNVIDGAPGYHTLNSYYFDKDSGLFILTFLVAPQPAVGAIYIIAFDNNGKIYMDELVTGSIEVNNNNYTLLHIYSPWTGEMCYSSDMDPMKIAYENILYEYKNDTLEVKNKEALLVRDLPKCE